MERGTKGSFAPPHLLAPPKKKIESFECGVDRTHCGAESETHRSGSPLALMTQDGAIELVEAGLAKLVWPKDDRNDVLLTKQAAARRLIEASIRTLFGREDPIVLLILASAAAGILGNLRTRKIQQQFSDCMRKLLNAASKQL